MTTSDFDVELFERRLHSLKDSQESIQALSSWCLERRQHHKKIVATWLQVLKKVKVEHRLTLFYLANDVIQYSKRKNFEFVESWGTTLQRATTMVRDEKVKHRILRIFKIWDQRQVYDEEFLADLSGLISAAPKKKSEPQQTGSTDEFQAALLISTMRSCATLEQATDARLRDLRESNIDIDNAEELCASLKDRRHVEDAEKEVDNAVRNVENYVRALEAEIRERGQILELLEQADQFYETQRGEVKIVTNAYRNFGSRVKNLKKKLDELLPTLVSPIPSPDVNAPSPSPDSDIELPGDDSQTANQSTVIDVAPPSMYGSYRHDYEPLPVPAPELSHGNVPGDFTNNFSSFIGGNMDFDMRNIFNDRSATPTGTNQYNDTLEAKPIEVINMRPSKAENSNDEFNISSFLKTVLPSSDGTCNAGGIPGLGLDVPDPTAESPQRPDYRHSPAVGQLPVTSAIVRMISSQGTPLGNLNNCQMSHTSTPLTVRNLTGDSHTPSPYSSQNSQSNVTLPFDGSVNSVNPLPPPPMPPPIFLDDENCYNKLPPKFPTWTPASDTAKEPAKWEEKGKNSMNPTWPGEDDDKAKAQWGDTGNERWESGSDSAWSGGMRGKSEIMSETPESPPMYEKSGFADPVEYNDSQAQEPLLSSSGDVDHRVIPIPMTVETQLSHRLVKAADVDHRNLISLTGSPANHGNINDPPLTVLANSNNLWSTIDQDYRQQMQPGDIVESVDMEMSDDETESKQKGRVLVDVRSQDRDMRGGPLTGQPPHHLDMDMRMIPLPTGQMPARGGQMIQDIRGIRPGQSQQFHLGQSDSHQGQPDFRHNVLEFRPNQSQNFYPNQSQNMHQNQQEFHQGQQEFHQGQHDFLQSDQQDFEFHENERGRRTSQEFHGDPQLRGRYASSTDHYQQQQQQQPQQQQQQQHHHHHHQHQQPHHHRDALGFHRNEQRGGRGRGFVRNRRDRYSEDHNIQQRNPMANNRRQQMAQEHQQRHKSSPEILPNNRPLLLRPPDTVVILDDDGMPIGMPEPDQRPPNVEDLDEESARNESGYVPEDRVTSSHVLERRMQDEEATCRDGIQNQSQGFALETETLADQEVPPATTPDSQQQRGGPNQRVPVVVMATERDDIASNSRRELAGEIPSSVRNDQDVTKPIQGDQLAECNLQRTNDRLVDDGIATEVPLAQEVEVPPRQLSEQLTALMNSGDDLNRQSAANGSNQDDVVPQDDGPTSKKRILLSNGPQVTGSGVIGPSGPGIHHGGSNDLHPVVVYEYDTPNLRPRVAGPPGTSFPPWRGGLPPRGRGGFRGGPRAPWIDRGPRGPPTGNFLPRGLKRGGQFRGGGFRGRGRGNSW